MPPFKSKVLDHAQRRLRKWLKLDFATLNQQPVDPAGSSWYRYIMKEFLSHWAPECLYGTEYLHINLNE